MKYLFSYFSLCLKKSYKSFLAILVTTVLLIVSLFLVVQLILDVNNDDTARQRVRIGMVGDLTESYMGISFSTIESLDDISMSIDFVELESEEEAVKALNSYDISAYILVPDNYITDIVWGRDVKLSFVMPKTSATVSSVLISEVVKIISPLVTEAEAAIYAMQEYQNDYAFGNPSNNIQALNLLYIDTILDRSETIDVKIYENNVLSMYEYYICGIATFFLLLFATACCTLFSKKELALCRLLCSKGAKAWQLVLCEYMSYFLIMLSIVLIFAIIGSAFSSDIDLIKISFRLILYILMISAMSYLIYEATGTIVTGVLAQFIIAVSMGYVSGCFYPYYFFPEPVQEFAKALPSGLTFNFLQSCLTGEESTNIVLVILYTLLFLLLSATVRQYRLRRDTL